MVGILLTFFYFCGLIVVLTIILIIRMKSTKKTYKREDYKSNTWYVSKDRVRLDYPVIENLSQWIIGEVPQWNPDHPNYSKFWSKETKKCIEGVWGSEWGKYRFMPGSLYFFGNYGAITHTWEEGGVKVTKMIRPKIMDYFWEFAYMSIVAYGFSGFTKDIEYSCNLNLKKYLDGQLDIKYLPDECLYNGVPKKYKEAYLYVSELKDKKLGKPLFQNECQDGMIFGSRRGGKSVWTAIGEIEYNYIFSGARRFDQAFIDKEYNCAQVVGSADTDKSSDLLSIFKKSQDCKTDPSVKDFIKWFGIWEEDGFDEKGKPAKIITPCPFYKRSIGNLGCPNKQTPYSSKYKVQINGQWKTKGDGNELFHVNYSTKKGSGSQAAVGNTYLFADVEEVGLVENVVEIKSANDAATKRGSKVGVQWFQGTSGNIEFVQAAKQLFLNPEDYGIISFENAFSKQGANNRIGYFIPKYVLLLQFKDENGNTDYDAALNFVNDERIIASQSKDPRVLSRLVMNEPNYPEEMWLTDAGYYLPYEEFAIREAELMEGQKYKYIGKNVELVWNNKDVDYKILHDVVPITDFPLPKDLKDPSGCVVIYEDPEPNAPHDLYFYTCDPYVEEDLDKGGSLAVTYIWKNPKYLTQGFTGNVLVASYIGKPAKGLEYYYEQQEKLIHMYGNTLQGLWYDAAGGGETLREYYIRKGKQHLLCFRPGIAKGESIYQKRVMTHGIRIGNRQSKLTCLKLAHDWCLEETHFPDDTCLKNVFRLPCMFLIRQAMSYNLEGNFDAISAFYFMALALKEMVAIQELYSTKEREVNIFEALLANKKIFNS